MGRILWAKPIVELLLVRVGFPNPLSAVFGPEGDKLHHNLNPFCHSAMLGASHQPLHLPEGEKLETRGDITIYSRLGCDSSLQYKGLRGDNCCYQDTFLVQARSRAFLRGTSLETRFDWICSWLSILSLQGWAWGGKVASQVWKHSSQNSRSQHLSLLLSEKVINWLLLFYARLSNIYKWAVLLKEKRQFLCFSLVMPGTQAMSSQELEEPEPEGGIGLTCIYSYSSC